jgi:hypothetical protein
MAPLLRGGAGDVGKLGLIRSDADTFFALHVLARPGLAGEPRGIRYMVSANDAAC